MKDFTKTFFDWLDGKGLKPKDVAAQLSINTQTVANWRSAGVPKGKQFACQALMDKSKAAKPQDDPNAVVAVEFDGAHFDEIDQASKLIDVPFREFIIKATIARAREEIAKVELQNVTPITAKKKANILAAAGDGIEAELVDFDENAREINVRLCGLSAVPLFQDDEVVSMAPRTLSKRSDHMAKGKLYLVRHEGTLKFKRYNTRPARPDEADAPYLTATGSVGLLESINPDFDTIEITTPDTHWIAWLEKDGTFPKDV